MDPVLHGKEHAARLWAPRDILNHAVDYPVGKGVLAYNDRLVEFLLSGADLEVSIWEET